MTDSTPNPSENSNQPDPAKGGTPPASVAATPPKTETPGIKIESSSPPPKVEGNTVTPEPVKAATPPPDPIPDTYELKAPDGLELDKSLIAAVTPVFKELGLTAKKAQGLADVFVKAQLASHAASMARDLERTMADPEIGQMNWGKTVGEVNRALAAFTSPEDRKWIEGRGDGNRLEYVRLFARIGRAMAEDRPARGSPTSAEKPTTASKLYGGRDLVGSEKQ